MQEEDQDLIAHNDRCLRNTRLLEYERDKCDQLLSVALGPEPYVGHQNMPLIQILQRIYRPPLNRPLRCPLGPITFFVDGYKGINVVSAAGGNMQGLDDAEGTVALSGTSTKVSCRLETWGSQAPFRGMPPPIEAMAAYHVKPTQELLTSFSPKGLNYELVYAYSIESGVLLPPLHRAAPPL
ncbi:hypothetical protein PHLCEN_2v2139 [Hermanssonia centrifuga]|uniref:Uncharacterized protein n=1 Tax=Hermanssonia centrifuga TaxID=98765 RepID=A0A2R6PC43_9APHY|nr:hypothetical protein PHLCEN_2v4970 [Hermanssonia centrifuga]PSS32098.1 hypothetical protein PHLCEN_2v2139 [Hermanssonia centrifuga]